MTTSWERPPMNDMRGFRGNNILNGLSGSDEIQGEGEMIF